MKVFVKTLKGTHFEIEVKPEDKVADVKKNLEAIQGSDVYPAAQQMLIHQGKVLKDDTTLEENKSKVASSGASTASAAPVNQAQTTSSVPPTLTQSTTASQTPAPTVAPSPQSVPESAAAAPAPAPAPAPVSSGSDIYGQAASNLVAGSNLEATVQQILDMGGGSWDRETVIRALRAAYNNPERAVEYLYSGIPEQAAVPPVSRAPAGQAENLPAQTQAQQPAAAAPAPTSGPNANPLTQSYPNDMIF